MVVKKLAFSEFEVPNLKGFEKVVDKDQNTDYLFINAPSDIYTVYFDSNMPIYQKDVLESCQTGSSLEHKYPDKKIRFFCPSREKGRQDALWYFNLEFLTQSGETYILPGQIMVHSDEVYRKTVGGKLPFVEFLEKIKLKVSTEKSVQ